MAVLTVRVDFGSIRVEIPALQAYVDLLVGDQQKEIDALTNQVMQLTTSLKDPTAALKGAVDANTQ